jgi:NAD-dependent deacetylase
MVDSNPPTIPATLVDALRRARSITVLTGAGASAESGVPTFRDAVTGLWSSVDIAAVASPAGFRNDPERVWAWYAERRRAMDGAEPNAGHRALVALAAMVPDFALVTQNIDGLHQRAGSRNVIELHGSLYRARCVQAAAHTAAWEPADSLPPVCERCGGLMRPDVVWFGETLAVDVLRLADRFAREADVFLAVGTSGIVEPAASLPFVALSAQAIVVEINPASTPLTDYADHVLSGPSAQLLPALVAALAA